MHEFTFGLSFLLAVNGTSDTVLFQEPLTKACVEICVPKHQWKEEVLTEAKRQGLAAGHPRIEYLTGEYYERYVAGIVRDELRRYWWVEERVWLATGGKRGKAPDVWKQISLADEIRSIGALLSDQVGTDPAEPEEEQP